MNDHLSSLYQATLETVNKIDEVTPEEMLELLEHRDDVFGHLQQNAPLSTEQKEALRGILYYDEILLNRMTELREEASIGLKKIAHTKRQKQGYETGYSSESSIIDWRK